MLSTFQKNSTYIPQNRCVSRVQIMLGTAINEMINCKQFLSAPNFTVIYSYT